MINASELSNKTKAFMCFGDNLFNMVIHQGTNLDVLDC